MTNTEKTVRATIHLHIGSRTENSTLLCSSQILAVYYFLIFGGFISLKHNLASNGVTSLGFSYYLSRVSEELVFNPDTPFIVRQIIISYCLHVLAKEVLCGQYLLCASTDSLTRPGIKLVREKMCFSNTSKEIWFRIKKFVVLF